MHFGLNSSLVLMKNCVFLNTAWITLTILSEKRGNTELPKTLKKQEVTFSFQVDSKNIFDQWTKNSLIQTAQL